MLKAINKDGGFPNSFAAVTCKLPNNTFADVALPVINAPTVPKNGTAIKYAEPVKQTNDIAISFIIPLYVIILEIDSKIIRVTIVLRILIIVLFNIFIDRFTDKPCNFPPKKADRNIHSADVVSKFTTYSDDSSPIEIGIAIFTYESILFIGKKSFDVTVKNKTHKINGDHAINCFFNFSPLMVLKDIFFLDDTPIANTIAIKEEIAPATPVKSSFTYFTTKYIGAAKDTALTISNPHIPPKIGFMLYALDRKSVV